MNTSARFRTALEGARTWLPRTSPQGAPLGEDILLARHGDAVTRFRQDRRLGVTVAVLRGGGRDSAPNRLDAVVPSVLPPAERAAAAVGGLPRRADRGATRRGPLSREDRCALDGPDDRRVLGDGVVGGFQRGPRGSAVCHAAGRRVLITPSAGPWSGRG
ncbi:hypothetical protein [Zhihengliuella halotolerans]|uniref:hypothetical protein n=1 Tax=Zhihengliuella halotolerans TaxID=370736 RepID=UPI00102C82BD|nr:hypothetical protein [Zhihengliuella halotolerans]